MEEFTHSWKYFHYYFNHIMMENQGSFIAHKTFLERCSKSAMELSPRQLIPGHVVNFVHPIKTHADAFILAGTVTILFKIGQR